MITIMLSVGDIKLLSNLLADRYRYDPAYDPLKDYLRCSIEYYEEKERSSR